MIIRVAGLVLMALGGVLFRRRAPLGLVGAGGLRRRVQRGVRSALLAPRGSVHGRTLARRLDLGGAMFVFLLGTALLMASPE